MQRARGFRELLDAAPDAMVAVDRDGQIVIVNAQAEELFGYREDELLGQSVEVLVPEAARRLHPGHRELYLKDPKRRPMGPDANLSARRKDGSAFPAEISLSTADTDDGMLVCAAIRDVTARARADAMVRGLLDAAPDATIVVNGRGRIAMVNAQTERLFGYERRELIGERVEILVPDAMRDRHPAHRAAYFRDPQQRLMGAGAQLAARRKDGSEFPADISLSSLTTENGIFVCAAVRDVSERLRLQGEAEHERFERRAQQSQRLESLGQLAGGVAHDFNNLLAAIINYASFVAEEVTVAALSDPDRWRPVERDIGQVRRAAERAAQLTHQLLAFARREVIKPRVLDLNAVVSDLELLLRRTLGEHVVLTIDLASDLAPVVADPGQLEQVLVNLAVNARDAMPNGGTLTIETHNIAIDDEYAMLNPDVRPGPHVQLRVSDTGTGMSRETIQHAFEPFYSTKPKGEGSGLGLATVYGIVTQSGGHVRIYSEQGLGTTFNAFLPASSDVIAADGAEPSRAGRRGGEKILIVEDEDAIREVARRILTRNGYTVVAASNGDDALTFVASDRSIDLLLTDVVMPQMQGAEVAKRAHALRPELRVLFMSGYAQPVLASHGTLDPGVVLLEKPFTEQSLLDRVREVLDARGQRPEGFTSL